MQEHAQILVAPLHDAACHVERLRAWVRSAQQPGERSVPADELVIKVAAVFRSQERRDGKHVLDLGGNFAKLDVFDQGQDSSVLGRITACRNTEFGRADVDGRAPSSKRRATHGSRSPGVEAEQTPPRPPSRLGNSKIATACTLGQALAVQAKRTRHADGSTEHCVGHVGSVDVVEVIAANKSEGLDGFNVAAAKGIHGEVLHGAVVIVDVVIVIRLHGHDASHCEDHVEQSQPWRVQSLALKVVSAERALIQHGDEDMNPLEVRVDQCLALPRPWDALQVLGSRGLLPDDGIIIRHLNVVKRRCQGAS